MARRPEAPPEPRSPLDDAIDRFKYAINSQEPQISDIMKHLLGVQNAGLQANVAPAHFFSQLEELAILAEKKAREIQHPDFTTFQQMAEGYRAAAENFSSVPKQQKEPSQLPEMTAPKS